MKVNEEMISTTDSQNMFDVLKDFPQQVRDACNKGKTCPAFPGDEKPENIIVLGMGGSAIGGDILRSYSAATPGADRLKISVNRNYNFPISAGKDACVIVSSYSGGTEETLSAFAGAMKKTRRLVCISSGGRLKEIAGENNIPIVNIPKGYQPRWALGYSFFSALYVLIRSGAYDTGAVEETESAIDELIELLKKKALEYSDYSKNNRALALAEKLVGKIPVVYSASERMDAVNLRWRGEFQENAKNMAFGGLLPEMNHNEINGWSYPEETIKKSLIK